MINKWTYIVVSILCCCMQGIAQQQPLQAELQSVDSLLMMGSMEKAEQRANLLYRLLPRDDGSSRYLEQQLDIEISKAYVHVRMEEDRKALKMALKIIDKAEANKLYRCEYEAQLLIALIYEKIPDWPLTKKHLDKALKLATNHQMDSGKSAAFVRYASYYRLTGNADSAYFLVNRALEYAEKFDNPKVQADAYMLKGLILTTTNYEEAIAAHRAAQKAKLAVGNALYTPYMYSNIAVIYEKQQQYEKALRYNDSAIMAHRNILPTTSAGLFRMRSELYESVGNVDSAYHYFKQFHENYVAEEQRKNITEMNKINRQYESDKKEAVIRDQNQWLGFLVVLAVVITMAALLILMQNRKIKNQNTLIQTQLGELKILVGHKENLLAELQHRVKNNLQQMISLLEIQKESLGHSNIEEAFRETKNRIQSMALLHSYLINNETLNEVDFEKYLSGLSTLVLQSYPHHNSITVATHSDLKKIPMETATPLGQIIVELMSNSIKHAFPQHQKGNISITATYSNERQLNQLIYADDGMGFSFSQVKTKGLGLEIVKGLTNQINGELVPVTDSQQGFKLAIYF